MRSIFLKGRNAVPNSYINSGNRFNKTKSNACKPARPLSCKGKPFAMPKSYEFLSNFLLDDDAYEDADTGIEDAIEANESKSNLLLNSTSANNINPGDIRKLIYAPNKGKPSPTIAKKVTFESELNINGEYC